MKRPSCLHTQPHSWLARVPPAPRCCPHTRKPADVCKVVLNCLTGRDRGVCAHVRIGEYINYNPVRPESSSGPAVLGHKPKSYPLPLRWRRRQAQPNPTLPCIWLYPYKTGGHPKAKRERKDQLGPQAFGFFPKVAGPWEGKQLLSP